MAPLKSAGRSSGDHVDHDPQLELLPDVTQQIEIDRFGVVFGVLRVDGIEKMRARTYLPDPSMCVLTRRSFGGQS